MLSTMKPVAGIDAANHRRKPTVSLSIMADPSSTPMVNIVVSPESIKKPSLSPLTVHLGSAPLLLPPLVTSQPFNATDIIDTSPRKMIPNKPKRPLTAYHIYFQIEREFIIQSLAGEDADKSIHDGKIYHDNVPERYRDTKLSPDWYFGPGKRAKRKHRKQHGKIGFLELSRVITSRWAKLGKTDPDINNYVSLIAKQELDEYKRELKEYRENLTKTMMVPVFPKTSSSMKEQVVPQVQQQQFAMMMLNHQMAYQPTHSMIASYPPNGVNQSFDEEPLMNKPVQLRQEVDQIKNEFEFANSYQLQRTFMWGKPQPKDELDYFIACIDNDIEVSPKQKPCKLESITFLSPQSDDACSYEEEPPTKKQRGDCSNPLKFVDVCDDDILSLWRSANCE